MDSAEKKLLNSIGKEHRFSEVLKKLTTGVKMDAPEKAYILAVAMLFIRRFLVDKRHTSYADLAYYIILKYSVEYGDYAPLYDFSVNFGFYPVAKEILRNGLHESNLVNDCLGEIKLDRFSDAEKTTLTLEQYRESIDFIGDKSYEACYFAPTSFGKSSLIVDRIKQLGDLPSKIVIIVPTKSLLIQTYQMIRSAGLRRKLMIHDEMYNEEKSFIAVFTQERALRLLSKQDIFFDLIFIDEAHNLLKGDSRSILLSRVIGKNRSLNPTQQVLYLSPLVKDAANLRLSADQDISSHTIKFNIKEPEIYEFRLDGEVHQYNRFVNNFYKTNEGTNINDYIKSASGGKNFVYNYRPVKVEQLAHELCEIIPKIEITNALYEVVNILANEVHPDFYAIQYLKHGVVYLHGKLPDTLKEYIEYKYKNIPELKYVVANSVILEGINLPIDTLFIFNTHKLQGKELINLIGRVNRLNTIFGFNENRLSRLLPKIHFINNEKHCRIGSKMENKIKLLRSRVFDDQVENPTLNAFDIEKLSIPATSREKRLEKTTSIQENEKFLTTAPDTKEDEIRAYLIESGITEFYVNGKDIIARFLEVSSILTSNLSEFWIQKTVMDKVHYTFLQDIGNIADFEISRLSYVEARNYYENHILVTQKNSLKENIKAQVRYFKMRADSADRKMYFGTSYGEEPRETGAYPNTLFNTYIDMSKKSERELVNLAIVKLKMEDDFVSFKLNKLIVMLFDYGLISTDDYNQYVYGTTDERKIAFAKYGLKVSMVSRLEADGQLDNLWFDDFNNLQSTPEFDKYLLTVNDFHRFEIGRYIG